MSDLRQSRPLFRSIVCGERAELSGGMRAGYLFIGWIDTRQKESYMKERQGRN